MTFRAWVKSCNAGVFLENTNLVTDRHRHDHQSTRGQLEAAMARRYFKCVQCLNNYALFLLLQGTRLGTLLFIGPRLRGR